MSESGLAPLLETVNRVADAPPGLDVSADLTVTVAGHELAVEAYTDRVFVEFPSVGAVVDVLRATPETGGTEGSLPALLVAADLTAVARVAGHDVATFGEGSGLLRYAGYENVRLQAKGLLLATAGA